MNVIERIWHVCSADTFNLVLVMDLHDYFLVVQVICKNQQVRKMPQEESILKNRSRRR